MACGEGQQLKQLVDLLDKASTTFDALSTQLNSPQGQSAMALMAAAQAGNISGALSALKTLVPGLDVALDNISSEFDAALSEVSNEITGTIKESAIGRKLHDTATSVLKFTNDPIGSIKNGALQKELDSIKEQYPGVDVEEIKQALLDGKLTPDTVCKLIPNLIKDAEGNITEEGTPVTAPEDDPTSCHAPPQPQTYVLKDVDSYGVVASEAEITNMISDINSLVNALGDTVNLKENIGSIG